jgi:hypothetical protein
VWGGGGAAFKQDFATEIDDMQPLVVVVSPTYIHAKCSTGGSKWLWRQIGLRQTWQQMESTSHPVHLLYQQHMKNQQQNGIQKFLDIYNSEIQFNSNFWIYIIQKSNRFNSSDINLMNGVVA